VELILNSEPFAIACSIIIFSTCDSVSVPFLFYDFELAQNNHNLGLVCASNFHRRYRTDIGRDSGTGADTAIDMGTDTGKSGRTLVKSDVETFIIVAINV